MSAIMQYNYAGTLVEGLWLAIDVAFINNYTEAVAQAVASAFVDAGDLAAAYDDTFDTLAANERMGCPALAAVLARTWCGRSHNPAWLHDRMRPVA
jgi:hypothetical protein